MSLNKDFLVPHQTYRIRVFRDRVSLLYYSPPSVHTHTHTAKSTGFVSAIYWMPLSCVIIWNPPFLYMVNGKKKTQINTYLKGFVVIGW